MVPLDLSPDPAAISQAVRVIDLAGVLFNAILGGVMARSEDMDPIGFGTLAIMTALGGGMIRDTLMQRGTPVALVDGAYITTAVIGAAIAFVIPITHRFWDKTFPVIDAVALGAWAAAGAQKALVHDFSALAAVLLGTVTAVGGGVLRDVILRRIPTVFGGNTLYATSALAGAATMTALWHTALQPWATVLSLLVGTGLTLGGIWRGWTLPMAFSWRPRSTFSTLPRPAWWRGSSPRRQQGQAAHGPRLEGRDRG